MMVMEYGMGGVLYTRLDVLNEMILNVFARQRRDDDSLKRCDARIYKRMNGEGQ
jgi:hypothetical protein